ncbi:MAG TPA: MarR family transcriptional regulator [Longimicrobiaceae bacterium]|nr:MarR family transcriptional regulator [Longimicrobiaceae bacterium]
MHDSVQDFVERIGLMMESEGLPRISGRIFGFLMVNEGAYSLDEIARELQVSKASVSTNARQLEEHKFLERISEPGDRRDYYRMRPDAWTQILREAQRRWELFQVLFREGRESLPAEMEMGRERLAEAERFHALMLARVDCLLEEWEKGEAALAGGSE